jgi:hypothetical protein
LVIFLNCAPSTDVYVYDLVPFLGAADAADAADAAVAANAADAADVAAHHHCRNLTKNCIYLNVLVVSRWMQRSYCPSHLL